MSLSEELSVCYPLHWPVWHNDYDSLRAALAKEDANTELHDPRGRTVLHLAVSLGHLECARYVMLIIISAFSLFLPSCFTENAPCASFKANSWQAINAYPRDLMPTHSLLFFSTVVSHFTTS